MTAVIVVRQGHGHAYTVRARGVSYAHDGEHNMLDDEQVWSYLATIDARAVPHIRLPYDGRGAEVDLDDALDYFDPERQDWLETR